MQSSAIEMRSPAVSSMSISRPCGSLGHVVGEAHEVVGRLAHRRDHDHDVVARRGGCARCDRRRPGCDRGRRPRSRRTSGRAGSRPSRLPVAGRTSDRVRRRVCRFRRRAEGRQTRTPAQEGERARDSECREAEIKQQRRRNRTSATSRIAVVIVAIVYRRAQACIQGDDESNVEPTRSRCADGEDGARRSDQQFAQPPR